MSWYIHRGSIEKIKSLDNSEKWCNKEYYHNNNNNNNNNNSSIDNSNMFSSDYRSSSSSSSILKTPKFTKSKNIEKLMYFAIAEYSPDLNCDFYSVYHTTLKNVYTSSDYLNSVSEWCRDNNNTNVNIGAQTGNAIKDTFGDIKGILKGKQKRNLLKNLSKLKATLTEDQKSGLLFKKKLSFGKRAELIFRVLILEVVRQGAIFVDKLAIPLLKVMPGMILNAIALNLVGVLSKMILGVIPAIVEGTVAMMKDAFRDDSILKGVPFFSFGLQPWSLVIIGPALITRIFINYIKARVKSRSNPPKTKEDIVNEIVLMVSGQNPTAELLSK